MAEYPSVVEANPLIRPKVTMCCGSNCYTWNAQTYSPPSGSTRTYDDALVVDEWGHTFGGHGGKRTSKTFKRLVRQGQIVMDPVAKGRKTSQNYLVQIPYEYKHWADYYRTSGSSCCNPGYTWEGVVSHSYQDDLESLDQVIRIDRRAGGAFEDEVSSLVNDAKLSVYNDGIRGFDLLTEIAESLETVHFVKDTLRTITERLDGLKKENPRGWHIYKNVTPRKMRRFTDRLARRWSSRWLAAQYALLPLYLSLQEVREELHNRVFRFDSERAFRSTSWTSTDGDLLPECIVIGNSIKVDIRGLSKARYLPGAAARLFSRTGFNFATTAWELVPYSFVVDMVTNIGDQIQALSAVDFAYQRSNCLAVKREVRTWWRYINTTSDVSTRVWPGNVCRPAYTASHTFTRSIDSLLREETDEIYHRYVFEKPKFAIEFNELARWQHGVSLAALSYKPIADKLSKLR